MNKIQEIEQILSQTKLTLKIGIVKNEIDIAKSENIIGMICSLFNDKNKHLLPIVFSNCDCEECLSFTNDVFSVFGDALKDCFEQYYDSIQVESGTVVKAEFEFINGGHAYCFGGSFMFFKQNKQLNFNLN